MSTTEKVHGRQKKTIILRSTSRPCSNVWRNNRALSPQHASEVVELEARYSWKRAAFQACIRLQAFNLGVGDFELAPAELEPNSPRFVEGSLNDRSRQVAILKRLLELGLSRYTPDPLAAIRKAKQRALRMEPPAQQSFQKWVVLPPSCRRRASTRSAQVQGQGRTATRLMGS
jgi:hypothetical protein